MTLNASERRKRNRRRTLMGGTVRFASHTGTMTCVVRNLCAGGARLEMEHTLWLPDRFEVDIPHQNLRAAAKVIWREKSALGISFEAEVNVFGALMTPRRPARPVALPATRQQLDRMSYLEQERSRLEMRVKQLTDEF